VPPLANAGSEPQEKVVCHFMHGMSCVPAVSTVSQSKSSKTPDFFQWTMEQPVVWKLNAKRKILLWCRMVAEAHDVIGDISPAVFIEGDEGDSVTITKLIYKGVSIKVLGQAARVVGLLGDHSHSRPGSRSASGIPPHPWDRACFSRAAD
jgi:hypothetical protein